MPRRGRAAVVDAQRYGTAITGHDRVRADQLLANPHNWRIHLATQMQALEASLSENGWVRSVTVNQRTGHLVDGHARVTLALRDDNALVPVEYIDVDEDTERRLLLQIDPIAAMAGADRAALESLLANVTTGQTATAQLLERLRIEHGEIRVDLPPVEGFADAAQFGAREFVVVIPIDEARSNDEVFKRAVAQFCADHGLETYRIKTGGA
jgi:hypothetical protein